MLNAIRENLALKYDRHSQKFAHINIGLTAVEQGLAALAAQGEQFHLVRGKLVDAPLEWPRMFRSPTGAEVVVHSAREAQALGEGWKPNVGDEYVAPTEPAEAPYYAPSTSILSIGEDGRPALVNNPATQELTREGTSGPQPNLPNVGREPEPVVVEREPEPPLDP